MVEDPTVSAQHAAFVSQGARFTVHDLASLNGVFVNNRRVNRQLLLDGDVVRMGNSTFVYKQA